MLMVLSVGLALAGEGPSPLDAVVLLVQGGSTCAGAFVDADGTVATAYHCVAQGGRPRITTRAGLSAIGRVVAVDPRHDLAVVIAPQLASSAWLPIRRDPPQVGDTVRALGHPLGSSDPGGFFAGTLRWSLSQGVVAAVGERALQVTAPVNPGNSGGPIVDVDGRIVGVVSRRLKGDGMGFAGRADRLADLLSRPHRMAPTGGTFALAPFVMAYEGTGGTVSVGGSFEVAVRDRVVGTVALGQALSPRWESVRFGRATWVAGEARGGLRQRLFRGRWTTSIDVYGGLAVLRTYTSPPGTVQIDEEPLQLRPLFGGGVTVTGVGLHLAALPGPDGVDLRGMLTLQWPGVVGMF